MFKTLVQPILTYGSDVWANNKSALNKIDKVFLRFIRCSLSTKATTSNIISIGESGQLPPSVACKISLLNYCNRLHNMPDTWIAKKIH